MYRHPGYGCWLSGIDVNTQLTNQKHNDPYLAVVVGDRCLIWIACLTAHHQIDPNRTISAGKVDIGAFRTYPEVGPYSLCDIGNRSSHLP